MGRPLVEISRSGRATCRECNLKISKDELRVGVETSHPVFGSVMKWNHAQCFPFKKFHVRTANWMSGFNKLCYSDRGTLEGLVNGQPVSTPRASQLAAFLEESDEEDDEGGDSMLAYCPNVQVVGCQYYQGTVHPGEFVVLVREPSNPYDSNAIRVDNLQGHQVGHIKRATAAALAPVMDACSSTACRLEASVTAPPTNMYSCPVEICVFGKARSPSHELLQHHMRSGGMAHMLCSNGAGASSRPLQSPSSSTRPPSAVHSVTVQKTSAQSQADLDRLCLELDVDQANPLPDPDVPFLSTELHHYQKQGVAWMLERELNPDRGQLPPFWCQRLERGHDVFFNSITNSSQPTRPECVRGGILADEMGLGKSLQVISLCLVNPPQADDSASSNNQIRAQPSLPPVKRPRKRARTASGVSYSQLKASELTALCVERGIVKSGTKAKLVQRLQEHDLDKEKGGAEGSAGITASGPAAAKPRRTLVVCPSSVICNWETQIRQHVHPGAGIKLCMYHGADRCREPEWLACQDVVVTSYAVVASELAAHKSEGSDGGERGLHAVPWHRVVLDEAHTIRNCTTKTFQACKNLQARHRWCLTGTPLQNRAEDVQALFSFLQVAPVSDQTIFRRAISRPLREGSDLALQRLSLLMKAVCLRRNKTLLANNIPPKTVEVVALKMDPEQQASYQTLYKSIQSAVQYALEAGEDGVMQNYASVLECLLRLRQICCCPSLVKPERILAAQRLIKELEDRKSSNSREPRHVSAADTKKLFDMLKEATAGATQPSADDAHECAVCLQDLDRASARILAACFHTFCQDCLQHIEQDSQMATRCPLCRRSFSANDVLDFDNLQRRHATLANPRASPGRSLKSTEKVLWGSEPEVGNTGEPIQASPKVRALVDRLMVLRDQDAANKAVVFSQFTSFLNVIAAELKSVGVPAVRLDGSLSADRRKKVIAQFTKPNVDGAPPVFLISTKAGGQGLNLTCANTVFLMDMWWNAAVDEQAMDRVHRLGQTKPVTVVRFVCHDSVEERILDIQEAKKALGRGVLGKASPEEMRKMRMEDLRRLLDSS